MTPGQAPQLQEVLGEEKLDEAQGYWVELSDRMSVFVEAPQGSKWVQISNGMQVLVDEEMLQEGTAVAVSGIGQEISTGVQEVLVDIFARDIYREWGEKGMLVQRLSSSAYKNRIVEPDDQDAKRIVQWIVSTLKTSDVNPEDMVLIQLPNGFIMEIPCMQRKIIFRRGYFTISSPAEMRGCAIRDDGQEGDDGDRMLRMREALLHDFCDMNLIGENVPRKKINLENREKLRACIVEKYPTSGSFFAMQRKEKHSDEMAMILKLAAQAYGIIEDPLEDIEAFKELGGEIYWRNREIDLVTPAEQERSVKERAKYEQSMIDALRSAFSVSDLCYMELEEARTKRVGRRRIVDIAKDFGIYNVGHNEIEWLRFVARIYGSDNPIVQRAARSLTMSA